MLGLDGSDSVGPWSVLVFFCCILARGAGDEVLSQVQLEDVSFTTIEAYCIFTRCAQTAWVACSKSQVI